MYRRLFCTRNDAILKLLNYYKMNLLWACRVVAGLFLILLLATGWYYYHFGNEKAYYILLAVTTVLSMAYEYRIDPYLKRKINQ
jgi:hypothetical protein